MSEPAYDDGLDADGFPVPKTPWRKPYIRGSESEAGDWVPTPLGHAVVDAIERISHFVQLSGDTDSPIETHIGAAVLMFFDRASLPLKLCKMIDIRTVPDALLLVPQFAWGHYRSDWAILNPKRSGALLIECDGKEFHSSKEQRAHDARKDAAAADRGYLTMRFTGSRIHRDADGCAQKIFDAVCGGV
jgi:very-short-patch-repair endonuclease